MRPSHLSSAAWLLLGLPLILHAAPTPQPPFERTEKREPCAHYERTRQVLFGETHLHTQYSMDAATLDTRNTPTEAYRFAKGERVGLPPFVDTRDDKSPETVEATGPVSPHPYCFPGEKCQYTATRTIQLPPGRQLDFAAITDHAELFGETNVCFWEGTTSCANGGACPSNQVCLKDRCVPAGYLSEGCTLAREEVSRLRTGLGTNLFAQAYVVSENPARLPFCRSLKTPLTGDCVAQARNVWQQIQQAAEGAYDRTSACRFTSFIAYEYTATPGMGQCSNDPARPCWDQLGEQKPSADCPMPGPKGAGGLCEKRAGGDNLHRNILFRNDDVLELPLSNIEAPTDCGVGSKCKTPGPIGSPEKMLSKLKHECIGNPSHPRCDVLSIPHNSNISGGAMFLMPETPGEASIRAEMEPLVELFQIKGSSECKFTAQNPDAWNTPDELCGFESMSFARLNGDHLAKPDAASIPPNSFVRNALKNGLAYEQRAGVNPFRLGFVGGLDNHNGTPGASDAALYARHGAHGDSSFAVSGQILDRANFLGVETNGGGLTAVWAEENSRDSIFAAMKRRETYATSGTRVVVRFFGGFGLPAGLCHRGDFAEAGYASGVPMGGMLKSAPAGGAPRFAVSALMDRGWQGHEGTKLQRIQIIKGWVDGQGHTHERVYDVAGNANNGASVELATCQPTGPGAADLCTEWTDPAFDPRERAFYYARVLENPSCRWSQLYCNGLGVNCLKPFDSTGRVTQFEYQQCCSEDFPRTAQQRAWTSPIWYSP